MDTIESKTNDQDELMTSLDMILVKEPNGRDLKYKMSIEEMRNADNENGGRPTSCTVEYNYGPVSAKGKTHWKYFHDDRASDYEEPIPRLYTCYEKACAFIKEKYEELSAKGYVSVDKIKDTGYDPTDINVILPPGGHIYLERRDEYTEEKSFLFLHRYAEDPSYVEKQWGDIGGRGLVDQIDLENVPAEIAQHQTMLYKRKKLTLAQLEKRTQSCKIKYMFQSDSEDEDLIDELLADIDATRKKNAKKRRQNPATAAAGAASAANSKRPTKRSRHDSDDDEEDSD